MSAGPELSQMLGRIDGKLDQVIETFKEHRDDDKRRFTEVYQKLDEHSADISKAKGATKLITWLLAGGAAGIAGLVYAMANGFPHK